mmetsp:Transcript_11070/g.12674  ORF Transcript_11070/g.12674 Transcript_11070/m.12674 type:complete len:104 (-) Transcript_11070:98-409(-)
MAGAKDNDLLKKSSTSSWKTLLIGGIFGYVFAMMSIMHGDHYSSVGMRRLDEVILGSGDEKEEEEEDMLDLAFELTETSRLGCQIKVREDFSGTTVRIPDDGF